MSEIESHAPGTFCWVELGTTDQDGARRFYTEFFGWEPNEMPMGEEHGTYTLLQIGGKDVAALYGLSPEQRSQGVPPNWLAYVAVASVDETVAKATALGGQVALEPMDVWDLGRMALLQDPTGAIFGIWQAGKHIGTRRVAEPHTLCWNELNSQNTAAVEGFYTGLFGWSTQKQEMGEMGTYTVFMNDGWQAGGMFQLPPHMSDVPSGWRTYFSVEDCDAAVEKAQSLGAEVAFPSTDIPDVGRFAALKDPQGALFLILKMIPQPVPQV